MKRALMGLLLCAITIATRSQGKIELSLLNEQGQALPHASVELLRAADSTLLKTALSDEQGLAFFEAIAPGRYLLRATAVNHAPAYSAPFLLENTSITVPTLRLPALAREMNAVTVTARKHFIQKLSDRIVVNVDNSILSAGSSAFELLERSPGVNIDPNDVISLRSRAGVIIMVDGKPTAMGGQDLVNYLRSLPSSAIERIEIITNPSAKYDAAGNSGIIDIRLKKDQRFGTNGNLTAGYGQGVYPKANGGLSFNHRNKKLNVFGSYNYAYRVLLNHLILDRNFFTDNGTFNGQDLKDNYTKMHLGSHTARLGADYYAGKNTIIGIILNGNFNRFRRHNDNASIVIDNQKQPLSTFETDAQNRDRAGNWVGNLNLKHSFDSSGREISADLDYGEYRNRSLSRTATAYYQLDGTPLQPDYILDGDQDGKLKLLTFKTDYSQPFLRDGRLEAGFKLSHVAADNDAKFWDMSSGTPVNDETKTNHFIYKENNNAAYLNLQKRFGKWGLQAGLRAEQTHVRTRQAYGNIRWDSSYLQFFPSVFVNYHLAEEKTLGFSVSRRIDRPGYNQLNPFLFLIDVTTYSTGRPGLLPQLTWSYEASYTVKGLSFTLGYSHTRNDQNIAIARFRDVFPDIPSEDNVTVQIPINLKSSDYVGLSIAAPIRINNWWSMLNNANFFYQKYNGQLGITQLNRGRPALQLQVNNTFSLKKGWSAELNGNLNTGGQYGFMELDPQWALSAGVQKQILKNRGTIRFNITDIFWTNLPNAVITYDNYVEKWHAYRETRVASLNFTWRFGSNKVQQARRRNLGSEEERRRAG